MKLLLGVISGILLTYNVHSNCYVAIANAFYRPHRSIIEKKRKGNKDGFELGSDDYVNYAKDAVGSSVFFLLGIPTLILHEIEYRQMVARAARIYDSIEALDKNRELSYESFMEVVVPAAEKLKKKDEGNK